MNSVEKRFWSKVNILEENDCWNWLAGGRGVGYGCFKYNGKAIDSHRMAWFLTYGEFPNLLVCHSCDNRACCNPNHLFLGTYSDNAKDAFKKGRRKAPENKTRGENRYNSKLKDRDVIEIKNLLNNGIGGSELARKFNVTRGLISNIKTKKAWDWI